MDIYDANYSVIIYPYRNTTRAKWNVISWIDDRKAAYLAQKCIGKRQYFV